MKSLIISLANNDAELLTGEQGFEFIMRFLWFAADEIFGPSIKKY